MCAASFLSLGSVAMRSSIFVLFCLLLVLVLSPPQARAANVAGSACSVIGQTVMDDNKQNIIACVYSSSAATTLVWKAMTDDLSSSNVNVSCPSGQAVTSIVKGVPSCGTVSSTTTTSTLYKCPIIENSSYCRPYEPRTCLGQTTSNPEDTCTYWSGSSSASCHLTTAACNIGL